MTQLFTPDRLEQQRTQLNAVQRQAFSALVAWFLVVGGTIAFKPPAWLNIMLRLAAMGNAFTLVKLARELDDREWSHLVERDYSRRLRVTGLSVQAEGIKRSYLQQLQPPRPEPQQPQHLQQQAIDVPAQSLPQQQAAAEIPAQVAAVSALEVRDLTEQIARYDGHVLIASRTGSGKTTTVQASIAHTMQIYKGNVDFWIFDPKGASWCGLEKTDRWLMCNTPESIPKVIERLVDLCEELENRQWTRVNSGGHWDENNEPQTIKIIIDEYNTLRKLAKEYDSRFPPKESPRTANTLKNMVERFIFQGREDCMNLWLMAQTTRVEQLDLDTSTQDNMVYFAQARNADYQSVEDAIGNTYVVTDPRQRKILQAVLADYKDDRTQNPSIPIAFTTLGGNQLCKLPDLNWAKTYRLNDPITTLEKAYQAPAAPSYDDRYPPNWGNISALARRLTGELCCFPGCQNRATETHHAYYPKWQQGEPTEPGEAVFPLCEEHHDRDSTESAHHPINWVPAKTPAPGWDAHNTPAYYRLLIQGWSEKSAKHSG
ncbi:MAG TPA: FtsK/SpoIIIE domain-containing protein [Trichocoleus sp.]|jgi:hypothetical protein